MSRCIETTKAAWWFKPLSDGNRPNGGSLGGHGSVSFDDLPLGAPLYGRLPVAYLEEPDLGRIELDPDTVFSLVDQHSVFPPAICPS